MWFKYGLKAQKLLAQGSALGIKTIGKAPCKGKSFKIYLIKFENPLRYVKLLPFQAVLEPQAKLESCYSKISDYSSCFFTQTL